MTAGTYPWTAIDSAEKNKYFNGSTSVSDRRRHCRAAGKWVSKDKHEFVYDESLLKQGKYPCRYNCSGKQKSKHNEHDCSPPFMSNRGRNVAAAKSKRKAGKKEAKSYSSCKRGWVLDKELRACRTRCKSGMRVNRVGTKRTGTKRIGSPACIKASQKKKPSPVGREIDLSDARTRAQVSKAFKAQDLPIVIGGDGHLYHSRAEVGLSRTTPQSRKRDVYHSDDSEAAAQFGRRASTQGLLAEDGSDNDSPPRYLVQSSAEGRHKRQLRSSKKRALGRPYPRSQR